MRRVLTNLYVQYGGQPAQALCANAQRVDLFVQLNAQLLNRRQGPTFAGFLQQLVHIQIFHEGFFCAQHGLLRCAADANAQHARRAPARTHGRYGFEYPVHQ